MRKYSMQIPTPSPNAKSWRVIDIIVGERHRKDMGDIAGLAASIHELGLLHPIVITPDGELIAGERRLRAAESLGWSEIPVTVVDLDSIVRGEFAENTFRKDFTLSEAVAIKRAVEPREKAAAKGRQGTRTDKHQGKLPTSSMGRAADKAAQATGMARRTLEKAEAVVDAAEAEPEKFGKLLADMDRTGRVNGPYNRLKVMRQAAAIRAEPPPYPGRGPYRAAVADVPWPHEVRQENPSHRAVHPYPTMSIEQLCAEGEKVRAIMHADSVMWFWVTNYILANGLHKPVLDAWGYDEAKTILSWVKNRFGHGDWLRSQTEHCILASRGTPATDLPVPPSVLFAPMRANSEKPVEFYELVESLCPAPRYADLFSRYRHNNRWDCHGDQAPVAAPSDDGLDIPPAFVRRRPA
jgi:N6-adenosine-specific RNA methylase IME4